MKHLIAFIGTCFIFGLFTPAFAAKTHYEMNWETGELTAYLPIQDNENGVEPYAHIWNAGADKTRNSYDQNFSENVTGFKVDDGYLVVTVTIPNLDTAKIVRIWAHDEAKGGNTHFYCNTNDIYAFAALNTTTGAKHYNHECLVDPSRKTITPVPRGTEMDKFESE